jgi:hypothetical protein
MNRNRIGDSFQWRIESVLVEHHLKTCRCSYCHGSTRLHYGLNIPKAWKARNSWYVIKLPFRIYLRSCVMNWFMKPPPLA